MVAGWTLGPALGAALVALPDDDGRVFSLSRTHGPAPVDLVGVAVLIAVWIPVAALLWSRRPALRGAFAWTSGVLGALGGVVLVVTVALDLGWAWVAGVMLLLSAQVLAVARIWLLAVSR